MQKFILSLFVLLFVVIFDARRSYAQVPFTDEFPEDSFIEEIPIICNDAGILDKFLRDKGWKPTVSYLGKENAKEDGRPVFIIIEYVNKKMKDAIIVTLSVPTGESCIVYRAFDKTKM